MREYIMERDLFLKSTCKFPGFLLDYPPGSFMVPKTLFTKRVFWLTATITVIRSEMLQMKKIMID